MDYTKLSSCTKLSLSQKNLYDSEQILISKYSAKVTFHEHLNIYPTLKAAFKYRNHASALNLLQFYKNMSSFHF